MLARTWEALSKTLVVMPKNLPRNQPGEPGRHAISIANIRSLISELQEYGNNWPGKRSNEQDMVIRGLGG